MEYPRIKFKVNKNLDKKMIMEFLGLNVAGVNFAAGIFETHPKIKKAIFQYIDSFYKINTPLLNKVAIEFGERWRSKEKSFFSIVNSIFENHHWPKGKYIGYLSIFDCNPRFLKNKTFQIFYKHKRGHIYIIAHELLHFIFYDYIDKKRKDLKKLSENELWKFSEIANDVLLGLPQLKMALGIQKQTRGYPALQKSISKIKNGIKTVPNIDYLIGLLLRP